MVNLAEISFLDQMAEYGLRNLDNVNKYAHLHDEKASEENVKSAIDIVGSWLQVIINKGK